VFKSEKTHRKVTLLGRAIAPKGFYTAAEAMKKLNLRKSTFYDMVERGQIKKIIPPNRSDGFYLKADIDRMAKAQELFLLQYATEPPTFEKAREEDIQGLYDVCLSLWGTRGTYSYDLRLARYRKNPDIFYVLKYAGIVVGYATVMPITKRAVDEIVQKGARAWQAITLDDILPFTTEEPVEYVFVEVAVRDDLPNQTQFAVHLILGTISAMEELAERGVIIKKIFAVSSSPDGIRSARKLGFEETLITPDSNRWAFFLDTEKSNSPVLKNYQRIVRQAAAKKGQKKDSRLEHPKTDGVATT